MRRIDDNWQISHDFVARQVALLLGRLRPNPWGKIGMMAASGMFLLILGGVVVGVPLFVKQQAFAALRSLQVSVTEFGGDSLMARFPPKF